MFEKGHEYFYKPSYAFKRKMKRESNKLNKEELGDFVFDFLFGANKCKLRKTYIFLKYIEWKSERDKINREERN